MGKKSAAKKKGKAADLRGYATSSIASAKKDEAGEEETLGEGEEGNATDGPAVTPADAEPENQATSAGQPAVDGGDGDEEEWERIGEIEIDKQCNSNAAARQSAANDAGAGQDDAMGEIDMDDEEYQKALQKRLDTELQKCMMTKRDVQRDATIQFDRKSTYAPAGVVVFSPSAEEKIEAALVPLRDTQHDDAMQPIFPKHWRFRGKFTWERLNSIYLALEAMNFKGEQIRKAMMKTYGYNVHAALEWLLLNLKKEDLPRQFGGEGMGDSQAFSADAAGNDANTNAASTAGGEAEEKQGRATASDAKGDASSEVAVASSPPPEEEAKTKPTKNDEKLSQAEINKRFAAQYCAAQDSDSDDLLDEEEKLERERKKDPTARYIKISRQFDELARVTKALKEKKKQGAFKQNISADMEKMRTATARMGSIKVEMEALEGGKYGKLDKERISQQKSTPAPTPARKPVEADVESNTTVAASSTAIATDDGDMPSAENATAAADDDAAEEELPSLFDDDNSMAVASASTSELPACRPYNINGWSGKTPRNALEEFARKRIWGKNPPDKVALYEKVPSSTSGLYYCRVKLPQPRNLAAQVYQPDEPCSTIRDSENLAAMFALYKLLEEHDRAEFTRGLPPSFKQRLQDWVDEAAERKRESLRESVRSRVTFILDLLRTKPAFASLSAHAGSHNADALSATQAAAGRRLVNEDDDDFQELSPDAAAKLRADFARRRETLQDSPDFVDIVEQRARLPVAEYRENLLRSIRSCGVLIVSGATGSGKTTQVPQFVLEDALNKESGEPMPNIIVTEPRRISAVSVAQRVSEELGDPSGGPGSRGSLVGYQIRLDKKATESTRLLFCTVGVLLKKMQQGLGVLSKVTHIFIDEVHERSAECDLLLFLLRQIRHTRQELRIVLMSATLEVNKLVRYFGNAVPVIDVPGRTFPVQGYWLEDVVEMTGYDCGDESEFAKRGMKDWYSTKKFEVSGAKGKTETLTAYIDEDDDWACDDEAESCDAQQYHPGTMKALARMDHSKINFQLITMLLEYIESSDYFNQSYARDDGAVLIFLPGLGEISRMNEWISRSPLLNNQKRFLIISLHSVLSGEDHARAFQRPPRGVRKIVLSTNIAETGVTIPDVVFVIDAGKVKSNQYHEPSNTSSLKEKFVSRAEVTQRRGRAGRVREGFSFHLITRNRFDLRLQEMPTPEMLRCSLMELMLSVLSSGLQPSCFLECLDPPPKSRIDQALATLKATGAVEEGQRPANALQIGPVNDDAWFITTPIGQCLSRLPCDVRLGKMVLLAALFGGIDSVVTIAAILSHRSPLATPFNEAKRAQAKQTHCAELLAKDGPPSDHFALNVAYKRWDEARQQGKSVDTFCRKSWLNGQVLQTIREIKLDLHDSVKGEGFCEKFEKEEVPSSEIKSIHTAAAILFAGLYPNVARTDAPKSASEKMPHLWSGNEQLRLHPGSLCGGPRMEGLHRTNHRWICYHTKLKTSQVFLRDATFVPPNALLLFGGDTASLNIHAIEKSVSIGVGAERNWHCFYAAPRMVAAIRQLRYAFDATLRRKASDPRKPLSPEDRLVIIAYIAVINSVEAP